MIRQSRRIFVYAVLIIENSWQFSSKKIEILWNFCKIVLNSKIFCCTFSKMLWNCQVLHGSLGKGCGIYCKILLISLQHDLLFMKLLEKRVKLLNFSDTQLCYNHSDSTVIPEILIFLGFLENFPFELIMLAVHGLHVVIIIRKLWNYSPIICEILLNLLIIWKFLLNFECSISEIHEKLLNF